MESNNELNEIDIKNCTCHYFDDIININDSDLDNVLVDEKIIQFFFLFKMLHKKLCLVQSLYMLFLIK